MTLKEKVREEIDSWYNYYKDQIDRVGKTEQAMLELAELLDSLKVEEALLGSALIHITLPEIQDARELLSKILEHTEIKQFIKVSKEKGGQLVWGYHVDYKKVDLTIYPAEPNKDCIAVKEVNTYTTWVCEKNEGSATP